MAALTRLKLFLGFVGCMLLITLSLHQRDSEPEKRAARVHHLRELRKKLIREMCDGDKEAFSEGRSGLKNMTERELSHLMVDDKHGIIYCFIPKVASTSWKRLMLVLNRSEPYRDPLSFSAEFVGNLSNLNLLNRFSATEMEVRLKLYTKFLFVRDPFTRLIATYQDNFLLQNEYFYKHYGRDILRLYANLSDPPQRVEEAYSSGMRPTFHNFVQYLTDPETEKKGPFDAHWKQMYQLCHPCFIQYDFVGHHETIKEDADHLLKELKLMDHFQSNRFYQDEDSAESLLYWFQSVPLEDRRKLYNLYEADYRLFGYDRPGGLLYG